MEAIKSQTKECLFCGEIIQVRAIKCRFCAEFLDTDEARSVEIQTRRNWQVGEDQEFDEDILFCGRPSLWGMAGAVMRGAFFIGIAVMLMVYPLENLLTNGHREVETAEYGVESSSVYAENIIEKPSKFGLTEQQISTFAWYMIIGGRGLAIFVALILLIKAIKLKMVYYEVTSERIEWSRGVLDRRVDNMDMFRVIDLRLRRSLLDCVLGIGTVSLITNDKTDPEFEFKKVRQPRLLYDVIKRASLEADRRDSVVHIE